ncbi:1896_t:CDS:2, partial [Racocetra persica]
RSNKLYAEKIVRLAEEYSQESNQNELFNNHNIDKSEPYQILELLTKQSTPEIKSSTFEYTNEDGTKAEITSISDLYTAAVIKRHAEESSSMPPPPRPPKRHISQNPQSIQPPQTRPNRPIVQMTSPMPGMLRLPNQQMPAQPQNPNQMPINVQMPAQQAPM